MKLFAHCCGNFEYRERMMEKVELKVTTLVDEKQLELEFLENVARELEK